MSDAVAILNASSSSIKFSLYLDRDGTLLRRKRRGYNPKKFKIVFAIV